MKSGYGFLGSGLLVSLALGCTQGPATDLPNVIIILCDDLGYGDVGCYGQTLIRTPHLDRMAAEGLQFNQAYAGSPVSAPSRATLMTGQHTGHTEVRGNKEYWKDVPMVRYGENPDFSRVGQHPYDPAQRILPELMKERGYTTALFGKWAGGYEGSHATPDRRGIDEFFGYICQYQAHLYYPNFLNRYAPQLGDTGVVRIPLQENIRHPQHGPGYRQRTQYSADLIHREAMDWLDRQTGEQPFLGLFTYTLPHAELVQPDDSLVQHYRQRFAEETPWIAWQGSRYNSSEHPHAAFAAMVSRLDAYVGEILEKLRTKGLDRNTLVLFTSDNGPHREGGADPAFFDSNGPWRGIKRDTYEGGIRVPFLAWWPETIRPGQQTQHPIAFYDIFATLEELTREANEETRQQPATGNTDGISFAPTLLGQGTQASHDFLYWEFEETDQVTVRKGDWKMISIGGTPHLYHLASDPHEDHDVAAQHPDIVRELVAIARSQHTDSPHFRVTLP